MLGSRNCSIPMSSFKSTIFSQEWLKQHFYQLLSAQGKTIFRYFLSPWQAFVLVCYNCLQKKKNPKPITIHSIYFKYASNFMFMWILLNVILVCLWRRYILQVHRETENSICLIFLNLIYFFKINLHAPLCNTCDLDQFFSFGFKNITAGSDSTDKYSLRGWSVPSSSL